MSNVELSRYDLKAHGGLGHWSLMPFEAVMDKFIRRENLALFKKRLAETRDEAERAVIVKLLADQEANDAAVPQKS